MDGIKTSLPTAIKIAFPIVSTAILFAGTTANAHTKTETDLLIESAAQAAVIASMEDDYNNAQVYKAMLGYADALFGSMCKNKKSADCDEYKRNLQVRLKQLNVIK